MKAAPIALKPDFKLMKQTDVLSFYHLQMPRWLFFDPKYASLSLEAKVVYTFLLNRFQLSRLNNWVNGDGEVFIIYTRASLAEEMRISYRKVIESMKELAATNLIWERRCGRGDANQIYLAQVELSEESAAVYNSSPFVSAEHEAAGARPAKSAHQEHHRRRNRTAQEESGALPRPAEAACPDVRALHVQTCQIGISEHVETALPDLPEWHSSNIDFSDIEQNINISQSVCYGMGGQKQAISDRQTDAEQRELDWLLGQCSLTDFAPEVAGVFANAIERLYFTEQYRIGGAVLPQERVRSHLRCLDYLRLREAERKLAGNTEQNIRNTTAYTMAVIFNTIWELDSDILLDPYLNRIKSRPSTLVDSGRW